MDKNLDNQINNIKRLINYSRSKTLLEQSQNPNPKASVEVGPISSAVQRTIETPRYRSEGEITGKDFDYPNYCGSPELTISGDEKNPAFPEWCMYKTPAGVMYFPKESKVIRIIQNEEDYNDLFKGFLKKNNYALDKIFEKIGKTWGIETEERLMRDFYDTIKKIIPLGSVRTISIDGKNYGISLVMEYVNDGSLVNDDGSKKDLSIVYRFNKYKSNDNTYYLPPTIETSASGYDIVKHEGKNLANIGFESISSYLCGPNSPFAGGEIFAGYTTESFACDILAMLIYLFGGPVGMVGGMSIEFINAKSLWDEGDRLGATICVMFAMLPLIGESFGFAVKTIVSKIGENGFTKVISFISNLIRFLLGDLKGMDLYDMYKLLSKEERKIVLDITSKLSVISQETHKYLITVYNVITKLDEIPGINKTKLLENLQFILDEANLIRGIKNLVIQFSSILIIIFGVKFIQECIDKYNEMNNTDFKIEDIGTSKLSEEEIFSIIDQMAPKDQ
jgi:hypothetical protein